MDIIGERWALFVIRELMFGPRRFSDLKAALPGISANVLTQRLEGLEEAGIVLRRKLPPPASAQVYELTEWGYEAEPLFRVVGRWAARSPRLMPAPMSVNSVILSLRTMFSSERAAGIDLCLGLVLDGMEFCAEVADGQLVIGPGSLAGCEAVVSGDQNALAGVIYGGASLAEMEAAGRLCISGNDARVEQFVQLFPLPERASSGNCARQLG